jgi:hypothetical protein
LTRRRPQPADVSAAEPTTADESAVVSRSRRLGGMAGETLLEVAGADGHRRPNYRRPDYPPMARMIYGRSL